MFCSVTRLFVQSHYFFFSHTIFVSVSWLPATENKIVLFLTQYGFSSYESWVVLYGMYVVGRQRRYLEADVFSSSGGLLWRVRSRVSAEIL